jgi:hypothetical protein
VKDDQDHVKNQKQENSKVSLCSSTTLHITNTDLEEGEERSGSSNTSRDNSPQEAKVQPLTTFFPTHPTSSNSYAVSHAIPQHVYAKHGDANPKSVDRKQRKRERRDERQRTGQILNRRIASSTLSYWRRINLNSDIQKWSDNLETLGVAEYQVHNLTEDILSPLEKQALAFGHNFIPKPRMNKDILKTAFADFARQVRLRYHFSKYGPSKSGADEDPEPPKKISKFYLKSTWKVPDVHLHPEIEEKLNDLRMDLNKLTRIHTGNNWSTLQQQTLIKLINKPDRLVITADKNLGYVYVTTDWYEAKVYKHLHSATYEDVTSHFSADTMNQIYNTMEALVLEYSFCLEPEEIKFTLKKSPWKAMKFYILAKVHKGYEDPSKVEGRPIAPSMTWITHNLSIWVAAELEKYIHLADTVLKDSTTLLNTLNSQELAYRIGKRNKAIYLISADVVALYPSINQARGLEAIHQFLINCPISEDRRNFTIRSLDLILRNCYSQFKDNIFLMKEGTAMGSSMCPAYANIFMYQTEKEYVKAFTESNDLLLYKRYIDDTCMIVQGTDKDVERIMEGLNELDPSIKFTFTSSRKSIDFLDIVITYKYHISKIITKVFQKKLNKYSYLPWKSWHTEHMKAGFIKGEAIRYARICSKEHDFKQIVQLFIIRLQKRGYPTAFILKAMSQVSWIYRDQYLINKEEDKEIPNIFKVEYNPIFDHKSLRKCLDKFSEQLTREVQPIPFSLKKRITICYKLPPKLHKNILKARKAKKY